MNDRNKESLSALMDGEADELELRRILNHIDNNDALLDSWKNYHLVGSIMRDEKIEPVDLTQGINQELDGLGSMNIGAKPNILNNETSHMSNIEIVKDKPIDRVQHKQQKTVSWHKPFTSVAVAASVMLAVLLGFQMVEPTSNVSAVGVASTRQYSAGEAVTNPASAGPGITGQGINKPSPSQFASTVSMDVNPSDVKAQQETLENAQKQLQDYVLEHSSNSDGNQQNNQTTLPFARVVEFQDKDSK